MMYNNIFELLRDLNGIIVGSASFKPIDEIKDIDIWFPRNYQDIVRNLIDNNKQYFNDITLSEYPVSVQSLSYANIISIRYVKDENTSYTIDLIFSKNEPSIDKNKTIIIENVKFMVCTEFSHKLHRYLYYDHSSTILKYRNQKLIEFPFTDLSELYKLIIATRPIYLCTSWKSKIISFIKLSNEIYHNHGLIAHLRNAWTFATINDRSDEFLDILEYIVTNYKICELETSFGKHFNELPLLQSIANKYRYKFGYKYWMPVIKPYKEFIVDFDNNYVSVPLYIELFHKLDDKKRKHVKIGTCCYTVYKEYRLNDEDKEVLWKDIKITNILR